MKTWLTYGGAWGRGKAALALCLAWAGSAQAEVTLLALGDSLTQGYGLPVQDGFVPQLQDWLKDQGHAVTVVNGGVSGDTTAGGLSRVAWSLTPEVGAMIVTLGGNDLLRGIAPEVARANVEGILQIAQDNEIEVLLVGMRAPGNYGPAYKESFDALYPELAEAYGTLYFPSFLEGLMKEGDDPAGLAGFMQGDGIHPNAQGVARIVAALGPSVEALIARAEEDK